jgi:large subunit ribosomal protein L13
MRTATYNAVDFKKDWFLVDAKGLVLGRMATKVAAILRGKHKPIFTPNHDLGDHVVVVNAADVVLTGDKLIQKMYRTHSGYIGGLKETTAGKLIKEKPDRLVTYAITGMLPKTKLGRAMAKKLRVYSGPEHPHESQNPVALGGLETARPNK